jgi:hypothetical protein
MGPPCYPDALPPGKFDIYGWSGNLLYEVLWVLKIEASISGCKIEDKIYKSQEISNRILE